jgi:uncharacterized tellurite resistance protein B-like protein
MGRARTNGDSSLADLQLRLLVAMAACDDYISPLESQQIHDYIRRNADSYKEEMRLQALLDQLLNAPPRVEDLLDELGRRAAEGNVGRALTAELAEVAFSDDVVDHREEFLLDLVCDVLGVDAHPLRDHGDPTAKYDVDDLRDFVNQLAAGEWRAA